MPPQILALSFGDDPINSGDTAAVQCTVVKGDAPISIAWYLNGQEVRSGDGIEVNKLGGKISVLSLEAAQARHSGEYTCRASNKAGHHTQSAELNVQGTQALSRRVPHVVDNLLCVDLVLLLEDMFCCIVGVVLGWMIFC